jgi:hypothetical protein
MKPRNSLCGQDTETSNDTSGDAYMLAIELRINDFLQQVTRIQSILTKWNQEDA